MLLLMAAARRAGEGERLVRSGKWEGWAPTQLLGTQVSDRRLGIFGMGRIGREIARMARGFGMEIHYRDMTRLPPDLEQGAIFHDSDDSFLPICQFLSLNAPGGEGTRHWLNAERIAMLPPGAVVVNAARGTLVDDAALIAALRSGQVAAAGLDVYNGEPKAESRLPDAGECGAAAASGQCHDGDPGRDGPGRAVGHRGGAGGRNAVESGGMRMARIAVGGFLHESHSFAPRPTTYADFLQPGGLPPFSAGADLIEAMRPRSVPLAGAIAVAEAAGVDAGAAGVGFRQSRRPGAGRGVRAHCRPDLRAACRLPWMRGRWMACIWTCMARRWWSSFPDAEGELLRRVRAIVGEAMPLTISLDPHANLTEQMVRLADVAVPFRTYPHVDMKEAGAQAMRLLLDRIERGQPWARAFRTLDFWIPLGSQCTLMPPMQTVMTERASLAERLGAVELAFCFGFPYADFAGCGAAIAAFGGNPGACGCRGRCACWRS